MFQKALQSASHKAALKNGKESPTLSASFLLVVFLPIPCEIKSQQLRRYDAACK